MGFVAVAMPLMNWVIVMNVVMVMAYSLMALGWFLALLREYIGLMVIVHTR